MAAQIASTQPFPNGSMFWGFGPTAQQDVEMLVGPLPHGLGDDGQAAASALLSQWAAEFEAPLPIAEPPASTSSPSNTASSLIPTPHQPVTVGTPPSQSGTDLSSHSSGDKKKHGLSSSTDEVTAKLEVKKPARKRDEAAKSRRRAERQKQMMREAEALMAQRAAQAVLLALENESLRQKSMVLETLVKLRTAQLQMMGVTEGTVETVTDTIYNHPADPNQGSVEVHPTDAASMLNNTSICPRATAEQLEKYRALSAHQFRAAYKSHLAALSQQLLVLESDLHNAEAGKALVTATGRLMFDFKHTSMQAPDIIHQVMAHHLESGAEEAPPAEHWRAVIRHLQLTPGQVQELLVLWQAYQRLMSRVLSERAQIQLTLKGTNPDHYNVGLTGSSTDITKVPPECVVLQDLMRNLRQEKSLHMMLRGFYYGHMCTVLQFARTVVYSYPYFPNVTSIVATVWEDYQQEAKKAGANGVPNGLPAGMPSGLSNPTAMMNINGIPGMNAVPSIHGIKA